MKQEAHQLIFGIEIDILNGFGEIMDYCGFIINPIDNPFSLSFKTPNEEIDLICE
jgi:hypothetical protein